MAIKVSGTTVIDGSRNIINVGDVDGRDVSVDGAKLDGIEAGADVTDTANVTAAGALMKTGGTMTGDLILNADPTNPLGAATKEYVDTIAAAGIHYHTPVRVEAPANLNATYNNGTSGVGATLTNAGTLAAISIDGVALALNDRVLIYRQTNPAHNGIYTVTTVGDGSTAWVLTRATDADSYGSSDPDALGEGDAFFVREGDTGAGELYVMNTSGTITFGTTPITFTVIAETAVYTAGTGVTLSGTQINIGQDVATNANVTFNNVSVTGTVDGRDVAADGTKLDTIETNADVTDTANVTAAGALMDSELTNIAAVKALNQGVATTNSPTFAGVTVNGNIAVTGTVDGRDVAADGTKLDGIEAGATGDQTAAEIRALVEAATDSNVFTDADHAKLNGIESGATADQTITAGAGLTGGGTGDVTISHADTSSQASVNNSGVTYIQDVTLDTYGHVTGLSSGTVTLAGLGYTGETNATADQTITAGAGLTGGGTGDVTISHADTSAQGSVNNSGRTFIQDITLDTYGHVTGITSATDADTYTGTVTSVATGGGLTGGTITTSGTISHADTSSQASVNNSGATVIQDVTLDTYGHVTGLGSTTLGSLALLNSVGAAQITDNSVNAAELNVSGNGSAGQALVSDGDGSMTWQGGNVVQYIADHTNASVANPVSAGGVYNWRSLSITPKYSDSKIVVMFSTCYTMGMNGSYNTERVNVYVREGTGGTLLGRAMGGIQSASWTSINGTALAVHTFNAGSTSARTYYSALNPTAVWNGPQFYNPYFIIMEVRP